MLLYDYETSRRHKFLEIANSRIPIPLTTRLRYSCLCVDPVPERHIPRVVPATRTSFSGCQQRGVQRQYVINRFVRRLRQRCMWRSGHTTLTNSGHSARSPFITKSSLLPPQLVTLHFQVYRRELWIRKKRRGWCSRDFFGTDRPRERQRSVKLRRDVHSFVNLSLFNLTEPRTCDLIFF